MKNIDENEKINGHNITEKYIHQMTENIQPRHFCPIFYFFISLSSLFPSFHVHHSFLFSLLIEVMDIIVFAAILKISFPENHFFFLFFLIEEIDSFFSFFLFS